MPPEYQLTVRLPEVHVYCKLRRECGLSQRSREAVEKGLPNTLFGVLVNRSEDVVGMGRIIGDGGCCFEVVDVAVLPAHQGRGLGAAIMESLVAWLRDHAPASSVVTLIADGEAFRLYERFGFRAAQPHSQGMLLYL